MNIKSALIAVGFLDNKYLNLYIKIINKNKDSIKTQFTECHHIIPRSTGGDNSPSNLVHLSFREHFIVHRCLLRCSIGKIRNSMAYAVRMVCVYSGDNNRAVTSKIVSALKRDLKFRQLRMSEEHKAKLGKIRKKYWDDMPDDQKQSAMSHLNTPESLSKKSKSLKKYGALPEVKERRSVARKQYLQDPDNLKILKNNVKESWKNQEIRNSRIEKITKGANGETFKKAQQQRWEEYWEEQGGKPIHHEHKIECELCGKKVKMMTRHLSIHHSK